MLQVLDLALVALAPGRTWALLGGCVLGFGSGLGDALFTPVACGLHPRDRARVANLLHALYAIDLVVMVLLLAMGHGGWTWRRSCSASRWAWGAWARRRWCRDWGRAGS